jgi:hypothetical protein
LKVIDRQHFKIFRKIFMEDEATRKPRKPRGPLSEASKEKIRQAKKGKKLGPMSAEHRKHLSNSAKGKKHSAESKAKMSASRLGQKRSPEQRKKMSIAHLGKVVSPEQKLKQLSTSLNSTRGPTETEIREKIRTGNKGKKLTEKNKLRSSLTKKGIAHIYIEGRLFTSLRAAADFLGHRYRNALSAHLNSKDPLWKEWYYLDDADKNPSLHSLN